MTNQDGTIGSEGAFEVAAGVVVQDGRYLITRRHDETHQGGLWEFPGGKREENESLSDCLRREIKEELDLDIEVGTLIRTVKYSYAYCTLTLHFYRCTIRSGAPSPVGCQDFRWVEPGELIHYPFPEANRPIIQELVKVPHISDSSK